MKIEKYIGFNLDKTEWFTYFYYYYRSQTNRKIYHGLYNSYYDIGVGYHYHDEEKGFWLRKLKK